MEDFHQAFSGLRFAGADLRILAQHVKFDFTFNDLNQQTVHGSSAGSDLLQYVCAFPFFLDGLTNALQLPLDSIHANEKLLLLFDGVRHTGSSLTYYTQYSI